MYNTIPPHSNTLMFFSINHVNTIYHIVFSNSLVDGTTRTYIYINGKSLVLYYVTLTNYYQTWNPIMYTTVYKTYIYTNNPRKLCLLTPTTTSHPGGEDFPNACLTAFVHPFHVLFNHISDVEIFNVLRPSASQPGALVQILVVNDLSYPPHAWS